MTINVAISAVQDIGTLFSSGFPTNTIGAFAAKRIQRNLQEKRKTIISEIGNGNIAPESVDDEFVSCIWRLHTAILNGISTENLKLLSRLVIGLSKGDVSLYANKFLHYASFLETLSYEELVCLAKIWQSFEEINEFPDGYHPPKDLNENDAMQLCKTEDASRHAQDKLIGENLLFSTHDEYNANLSSLTRTGLLIPAPAFGGISYNVSPKLKELMRYIETNIDDIIR